MGLFRGISLSMAAQVAMLSFPQVPFALDTTFRTSITEKNINSMVVLSDGRLYLSGRIRFPGDMSDRGGARIFSDGTQDTNFSGFTGGGRITAWQDMYYVNNGLVRRLDSEGMLDPSFILMNNGPYFSSLQGGDYHVYPDGRVLMSGAHVLDAPQHGMDGIYNLIWFSDQGYLDTTRMARRGNGAVYNFKELANGQFICDGNVSQFEGMSVDQVFRVYADGSPDTTFRTHVYMGKVWDFLPLSDGRVYAAGCFWRTDSPPESLWLVRFMPDGSLDPTWTAPQLTVPDYLLAQSSNSAKVISVRSWGDHEIAITGTFNSVNGHERWGMCVLDSTGQVRAPFGNCVIDSVMNGSLISCSIMGYEFTPDSEYCYVYGAYTGFSDGIVSDAGQAFISRLHVGDIVTGMARTEAEPTFSIYPNPTSSNVTVAMDQLPTDALLVLRDALGREVLRQRVREHYTTLDLASLGSGVYYMELLATGRRIGAHRVVVE